MGLPRWLSGKESIYNAGETDLVPELGKSSAGGNGTQSSILTWKIPWIAETGGLQSMELQRVRHE